MKNEKTNTRFFFISMKYAKEKIRFLFIPYIIISTADLLIYSSLRYFLDIKHNTVHIKEGVLDIVLPAILVILSIGIILFVYSDESDQVIPVKVATPILRQ